jgi:glucokinase
MYYLGLDIGATNTRCLLVTEGFDRVAAHSRPTPQGPTVDAFTAGVETVLSETFEMAAVSPAEVAAAGIASFGPLDTATGVIRETPNLDADLRDVPIRETVAGLLGGVPVALANDAVAGVVAEHHAGDAENLAYLTLSSGVGAGVVVDGRVLRGRGTVAEVGHFTLAPESSLRCGCGATGHWEAFAGGENIPRYAAHLAREGFDSTLVTDSADATDLTAEQLFAAYGDDELATATVDRVGEWNALGVANVVQAFAPERVAVGGAVALENESLVLEPIRSRLPDHVVGPAPSVARTQFGESVVVRGAIHLAMRRA